MAVEVPLTRGYVAIISDEDADAVLSLKWHVRLSKGDIPYAGTTQVSGTRKILMHRWLLSAPVGLDVDHINRDTLDNRRENLRLATRAQNRANTAPRADNRGRFKGVHFHKGQQKWHARIGCNGKFLHLGTFAREEDAARAYDVAALESFGEFALLNFPCVNVNKEA